MEELELELEQVINEQVAMRCFETTGHEVRFILSTYY